MFYFVLCLITFLYALLIIGFYLGFKRLAAFNEKAIPAKTYFSIIIPFRNEEMHLPLLLQSLLKLNYPKDFFEVILVDDASSDNSTVLVSQFITAYTSKINVRLIANERRSDAPKKDAITTAIGVMTHNWIVTTDADCIVPELWLATLNAFIAAAPTACVAGPVAYRDSNSFLNAFQTLDLLSLQGATIGAFGLDRPFLCNGANLAYTKALFNSVNGFCGNTNISSGDDIFLLEKAIAHAPDAVRYLKSNTAVVQTVAQPTWHALIEQRKRWAAKTTAYNSVFGKATGAIVFLMNLSCIAIVFSMFFNSYSVSLLAIIWGVKFCVDLVLIYKTALFFKQQYVLKHYIGSLILYPFFSCYVAILAFGKTYQWKDRSFKA